jgi:hypothetical protein
VIRALACSTCLIALLLPPGAAARPDLDDLDREKAWEARLQRLGDGPIYFAEVLFREHGTRRLFLLQTVLSPAVPPSRGMPGMGLDERGQVQPPPNPGHVRLRRAQSVVVRAGEKPPPPPLAETTYYIGLGLGTGGRSQSIDLHVSDLGTGMSPPKNIGDVTVQCFQSAIFRLERLSPDQAKKLPPLREDAEYFRRRTAALQKELLSTHRQTLLESEHSLSIAAAVLQEPALLHEVRTRLRAWAAKTPQEVDGKGWPRYLAATLAEHGEPKDAKELHHVIQRHPAHGWQLCWNVFDMIERHGTRDAMPLLRSLLENSHPHRGGGLAFEMLHKLDRSVPQTTVGDACLLELCYRFKLQPAQYGFQRVHPRLKELMPRNQLADPKIAEQLKNSTEWIMMSEGDRHRGVQAALTWLRKYTPPAPKEERQAPDPDEAVRKLLELKR